jgi:hypothetical protein
MDVARPGGDHRGVKRLAPITVVLTLVFAGSAHGGAGDDAHMVFLRVNGIPDAGHATPTIPCGSGERAIGGGVRRTPHRANIFVSYSTPFSGGLVAPVSGDVPTTWRSRIHNQGGISGDFYGYAICSASSDATLQSVDFFTSASPEVLFDGAGLAPCPAGQRAIGGGVFVNEASSSATLERSGPVDETGESLNTVDGDVARGWFAQVQTPAAGTLVRVYAVCSATSLATVQVESLQMNPNTISTGGLSVTCPAGTRALSGGVLANSRPHSSVTAIAPADSSGVPLGMGTTDIATGWYTYINNYSSLNTFKAAVVCEGPTPTTPPPTPTDPTNPTNPTSPTPSNAFRIGGFARNRDRGIGTLSVAVPGPGTVALESPKLKPQSIPVGGAAQVEVLIKAAPGTPKRKLRRKGKLKTTAAITFAPSGGTAASQDARLKLIRE